MKPAAVLIVPCLALTACVPKPDTASDRTPLDTECYPPGAHFAIVATDTTIYRQGAVVQITPKVDMSPAGTSELPLKCTYGWSLSGPATLSADHKSVAIAPDAPVGAVVTIGFRYLDKPAQASFKVVAKDEIVLTGLWSQRSLDGCSATQPVRELEFRPENGFSVTFTPFETYRDYWGGYAWDPDTGRIRLTVVGGNFVPGNLDLEGEAELKDGRLRLKDVFLGSRDGAPQSGCTYLF